MSSKSTETEQRVEELERAVEEANDLLGPALKDANMYMSHDEVRPSAKRGFDKMQDAHNILADVDPTRENVDGRE